MYFNSFFADDYYTADYWGVEADTGIVPVVGLYKGLYLGLYANIYLR